MLRLLAGCSSSSLCLCQSQLLDWKMGLWIVWIELSVTVKSTQKYHKTEKYHDCDCKFETCVVIMRHSCLRCKINSGGFGLDELHRFLKCFFWSGTYDKSKTLVKCKWKAVFTVYISRYFTTGVNILTSGECIAMGPLITLNRCTLVNTASTRYVMVLLYRYTSLSREK